MLGIASMGSMKKVGRVGGKALLYFEIVTTAALIIGIIVANVVRPGDGLDPSKLKGGDVSQYVQSGQEMKWMDFFYILCRLTCLKHLQKVIFYKCYFLYFIWRRVNDVREKWTAGNRLFERLSKVFLTFYQL